MADRLTLVVRRATVVVLASTLAAAPLAAQQKLDLATKQASHARMVKELAAIAERSVRDHKYHGDAAAKALWAEMAQLGDKAPWKLRLDGALAHLRLGATREGIAILEAADDALAGKRIDGDVDARNSVRFYLGMAWLRLAENENCCARKAPESCILPLHDAALHTSAPEGATKAMPWFEAVIANTAAGDYWRLSSVWLLNLAHMALGQ
jgi:hypothetical protein